MRVLRAAARDRESSGKHVRSRKSDATASATGAGVFGAATRGGSSRSNLATGAAVGTPAIATGAAAVVLPRGPPPRIPKLDFSTLPRFV